MCKEHRFTRADAFFVPVCSMLGKLCVVFYKQDKTCVLVIEVDGFAFHENNPDQLTRDRLKDNILRKYGIRVLRLPTNGSGEDEKIRNALMSYMA